MYIKNITRKLNKKRPLNNKPGGKLVSVLAYSVLPVMFALIIFLSPASGWLNGVLYKDFSVRHKNTGESDEFDINALLMKLSFTGIETPDLGNYQVINYTDDENSHSPYDKILMSNDAPITSIYPVYNSSVGAKIEAVNPSGEAIPEDAFPITPVNLSGQKNTAIQLLLNNQTSFTIDINEFIQRDYPIKGNLADSAPVVLILCTHATESYVEEGIFSYAPAFTADRTSDIDKNVVAVATALYDTLIEDGIPAVQSKIIHDDPSYNASYSRSLETINKYLAEYPSIKYVIDVHRDSIILATGEKYKPVISINGKNAAQLMLVVGTSDGGASHPEWQSNLTFAAHLQSKVNDSYPTLMRPINLRASRFNQHATTGSIILEVGSCGNSFDEAIYSAKLFGECLADLILENME